jgi:hypothetical protein
MTSNNETLGYDRDAVLDPQVLFIPSVSPPSHLTSHSLFCSLRISLFPPCFYLQILDFNNIPVDPTYWYDQYAAVDFGKFRNSTHEWTWWEPSDQLGISRVCEAYLKTNKSHDPGLFFSISLFLLLLLSFISPNTFSSR